MTEIEKIQQMSEQTGLGKMECNKALTAMSWNIDKAIVYCKMKGDCCFRFRIVNGKRVSWTEQDLISFINKTEAQDDRD